MATLEERSTRLMKPAKDLADWNFPFSEALEEYYTLLEEQQDVNLNKAALVLQNSANTFVRRVEYLYQDTTSLIRAFIDQETANETRKNAEKMGKDKKTAMNTIDFESIDFSRYVAKNINAKHRNAAHNSVKLLGQRFPQLENASRSLRLDEPSSENIDQEQDNDEDFVRKYAFRCNQYIAISGMLMEHLRPEEANPSDSSNDRNESLDSQEYEEESGEIAGDLASESAVPDSRHRAVSTPLPEQENDFMDSSFVSAVDSGRGSSVRSANRPESSLSCDRDGNWDSSLPRLSSSLSVGDFSSLVEPANDSGFGSDETPLPNVSSNKRGADENDCSDSLTDMDNLSNESVTNEQCRRSKRQRSLFDVETPISRPLIAIPFETVPDKVEKSRREFKLPCPLSLLKPSKSPKRKSFSAARKRRALEKFLLNEPDTGNKKMIMYSPTTQLFIPLMKDELEDLPKWLNKYLRNQRDIDTLQQYEAVTNESMHLLGYKCRDRESESVDRDTTSGPDSTTIISESVLDFPMPDTPESVTSIEETSPVPQIPDSRIELLVHDIHESSADVRTEQEDAVIRWHEDIQLKLKAGKQRPKFDMSDYTSRVLKSLNDNNGKITFDGMVRRDEGPEAARYLLATLVLANKYNVRIDSSDDEGNVMLLLLDE